MEKDIKNSCDKIDVHNTDKMLNAVDLFSRLSSDAQESIIELIKNLVSKKEAK